MADILEDWMLADGDEDWMVASGDEDWLTLGGAGFAMTVAGVDVADYLALDGSFGITKPLNGRQTLRARLDDAAGSYRPAPLAEVIVTNEGVREFCGVIVGTEESDWAVPGGIATAITVADYSVRLDRLWVTEEYAAGSTLQDVATALHATYLAPLGITFAAMPSPGPTLEAQTYTHARLSDVFNHLSEITGWVWRISEAKAIEWSTGDVTAAPFTVGLGGAVPFVIGASSWSLEHYRTRQRVLIGNGTRAIDYTFTGDGVTRVFPLPYPSAARPAQIFDGAAYRNVGIHGVDTLFEWTWRQSDNAIVQLAEAPPGQTNPVLAAGHQRTTVGYVAQYPVAVEHINTVDEAARGRWDGPPITAPDVFDEAAGTEIAAGAVRRYQTFPPPRQLPLTVWTPGLRPGQALAVTDATRNVAGTWLVTDLDIGERDGMELEYRVTVREGAEYLASWRDYWRALGSGTAASGSITGGAASGSPSAGSGLLWADLGGSEDVGVSHTTWTPVPGYRDWVSPLDGIVTARVQVWTEAVGTSVTPRIYDVTAGAAAITGVSSTATARSEQLLPFMATRGHRYRLQLLPGNTTNDVHGLGNVEA